MGNTKMIGKWLFRLENSKGEQDAILKCLRWFKNQPDPGLYSDDLLPCPCTARQARFDERYQRISSETPNTYCYYTRFPSTDNRGRKCCYRSWWRGSALIIGYPGGGSIDRYHQFTASLMHRMSDVQGFTHCCLFSNLCNRFYQKRPSEGCEMYRPPVWSTFACFNSHFT